jgi:hypothetical protein
MCGPVFPDPGRLPTIFSGVGARPGTSRNLADGRGLAHMRGEFDSLPPLSPRRMVPTHQLIIDTISLITYTISQNQADLQPSAAERMGPMVDPHGMSLRTCARARGCEGEGCRGAWGMRGEGKGALAPTHPGRRGGCRGAGWGGGCRVGRRCVRTDGCRVGWAGAGGRRVPRCGRPSTWQGFWQGTSRVLGFYNGASSRLSAHGVGIVCPAGQVTPTRPLSPLAHLAPPPPARNTGSTPCSRSNPRMQLHD